MKEDAGDVLFKKQSKACKALQQKAKKLLREKKRKEWWANNGGRRNAGE